MQWYADGREVTNLNRRFDRIATIGDWVLHHRRHFVGVCIDDVRRFPSTLLDFEVEHLQSNFVDFVDEDKLLLFFALSQDQNAFSDTERLKGRLKLLSHCINMHQHFNQPTLEDTLNIRIEQVVRDLFHRIRADTFATPSG